MIVLQKINPTFNSTNFKFGKIFLRMITKVRWRINLCKIVYMTLLLKYVASEFLQRGFRKHADGISLCLVFLRWVMVYFGGQCRGFHIFLRLLSLKRRLGSIVYSGGGGTGGQPSHRDPKWHFFQFYYNSTIHKRD